MTQNISISKIKPNAGQIDGLPANPRFIRDEKFEALKLSLQEDPEMLELRELIVFPLEEEYIIIGGNMRYRCALDLEFKELPCKILSPDTDVKKLRAITIKDNISFGQWDMDIPANEWDTTELELWGMYSSLPDYGILNDLEDGGFMDEVKNNSDVFSLTFSFKKEYKERVDNFLKTMGKEFLTNLIISNICQGVEVK